jgi:esterase/lipase
VNHEGTIRQVMLRLSALVCLLLVCVAASGGTFPSAPDEVEAYLAARERREPGITPGAERAVRWAGGMPARTPLALVYLHGYSATRQEVFPLAERVAASLGANLLLTRLTGHGRDGAAMLEGSVAAWQQDALEALAIGRVIGGRVVLLSTSTGGTLSTWLASRQADETLAALVMISPNFAARDRTLYLLDWPLLGPALLGYFGDDYRSWMPLNARQARYWTWSYPYRALPELVRLMKGVEAIDKSTIRVPTLMIYSPRDQVIDPAAVVRAFADWGGERKRLVAFDHSSDPSQHVLAGDILSPGSTDELARLISDYLSRLPGS